VSERRVHPANALNELSGEEWLYFTKSLWTTAYPSELGHARRRAHGANKPPRLMARLIEFFTRGDELVLDPFAGVGGTLLGAAICRTPRRALGFEIEPRWVATYEDVVRDALLARDGEGEVLADLGSADPGGPRRFDPTGCRMVQGDALRRLAEIEAGSVAMIATDPPYNPQLRMTMAGGAASAAWANRRTDYAMITDDPADIANSASYPEYLERMTHILAECRRVLRDRGYATIIVRDAYQDGRYRFTGSDLAARAEQAGLIPKGDLVWYQAGTRLRPYGYPRGFVPNIVHQHILVLQADTRMGQPRSSSAGIHTKDSVRSVPGATPTGSSDRSSAAGSSSSGAPEYQMSSDPVGGSQAASGSATASTVPSSNSAAASTASGEASTGAASATTSTTGPTASDAG
jgi:DNA modification methylase